MTALVLGTVLAPAATAAPRFTVLVFDKVNGYHHDAIPAGRQAITELGAEHGFEVVVSDDAALFTDAGLARFAKATASPSSGKAPLTVRFTDKSTDPDGRPLTHEWDFDGDGRIDSTAANPVHTFTANGTHLARLIVTDPTGRREPVNVRVTVGNTAPKVSLRSPLDGEVFDWGVPIPYQARVTDPDGGVDCEEPLVTGGVGHARQVHPVSGTRGCAGALVPSIVDGHTAADDLTYVLEATYTDTGRPRLTDRDRVTLQPRRKEAEHYDRASGVRVVRNSEGGGLVSGVSDGDWLSVTPVHLRHVGSLTFRVAGSTGGGTIEVRFGAPDGPLLGSVAVPVTGGGQTWTEVRTPVVDPGSTHELFLVARNPGVTGDLFNVDWFEFGSEEE
ncbi:carbohydrate-binding protein [Actinophytocola sp. KF-1]